MTRIIREGYALIRTVGRETEFVSKSGRFQDKFNEFTTRFGGLEIKDEAQELNLRGSATGHYSALLVEFETIRSK